MRFEILGPARVSIGNREIAVTAGRNRTLLAMLVLHANQAVPVADLIDGLWAGNPPKRAHGQLQGCVSRLRRQLADAGAPGQVIITEPDGYCLQAEPGAVDLLEFRALVSEARSAARSGQHEAARERYRAALGLWRGPALAGIGRGTVTGAAGLDEERAQALEECIDSELALGAGGELVSELTGLVHDYPYRERVHAALMLALYRADRQADALSAYQHVRRILVAELGQEPGPVLRNLHQRILTGDPDLRQDKSAVAEPAPAAGRGLPRTLVDFTGRAADLAWLLDAADQPDAYASLVLAIDGMPGVGKTSLAVHAAHLLAPRYPDGQLFVNLHGHSDQQPLEPAAALDTLLRQLGIPPASIPTGHDDRIARWRAELADRRVLVLLDNAASSDQVSPLLPATAGCLALVTSRRRLVDLDGARPRSIETLCQEDAVALLALVAGERVHDEPAAAAEVATRCGHLPLALRLAGARLAHRPRWRVQDLANRLSGAPTPLAELTAADRTVADAFALSYAHLTPAAQRLFRLLGLHPGEHFAAHAAAALADTSLTDSRRLLDELADAHLVEEPYPNRYRYHDLVKVYALQLSESTDLELDRRQAIRHLLDYYLHSAATAGAELESPTGRQGFELDAPARPELVDGHDRGWLETERSNLVAATRAAAVLGELRYAWQIARAMWKFLLLRCYLDDLVETHRCGLASAEGLSEPAAAVMMRNGLASAYFQRGDYDGAVEHVRHIVAWREKTDDLVGEAIARKNLAVTYAMDGQADQAIEHIECALATARRSGNLRLLAPTVANAGFVYGTIGRHALALHHSRRSLGLAREVGDHHLVAIVLGNVGTHRARLGEPGPALRLLNTALALKRRFGNRPGEAETLRDIGMAYRMLRRLDEAVEYHRQALTVMRDIGDRPGESTIYNEFGDTLRAAGNLPGALGMHRRALELATKIRHRYNEARALDGIAACLRDTDPDTARRHWLRALELYEELGVPDRNEVEHHLTDLGESR